MTSPNSATTPALRTVSPDDLPARRRPPVDRATLDAAQRIIDEIERDGDAAVRRFAERFGECAPGDPLVLEARDLSAAADRIDRETRGVLERVAERIGTFARAQRDAIAAVDVPVPGGRAGHDVLPVASAGCYAPGGRYPLPSSALMTAVTARAAGVERVVVASPGAHPVTLAAAAIAGADAFLPIGGAHAIAAFAFGIDSHGPLDMAVGPGNKWVTAAKQLLAGRIGIDMLAGPSELLVLTDASADPATVAADLLSQAEHDPDAVPSLITTDPEQPALVNAAIAEQLAEMPTRDTAAIALGNGFCCVAPSTEQAARLASTLAPEHLEIHTSDPEHTARLVTSAGGVFIGEHAAEVLGDYGAGPNHTLPTGGTARFSAGLSVSNFLRLRTWLRIDDPAAASPLTDDAAHLARIEGLIAHERSADRRRATR